MGSGVIYRGQSDPLPPLNAIVDAETAAREGWDVIALGEALLAGGARFIQIRAKQMSSAQLLRISDRLVAAGRACGARIIVNDRVDVAKLSGAAGVHLGQDDIPVADARAMLGPDAIIGYSTHTVAQIEAALLEPVTYIAVGPVFGTRSKDTGYEAVGLALVREAARRARGLPVAAIGGITLDTAPEVLAAGATSVAVISDLLAGGDPAARTRRFVEALR
jgi:thiamine-phosphate pyrophosphorylase